MSEQPPKIDHQQQSKREILEGEDEVPYELLKTQLYKYTKDWLERDKGDKLSMSENLSLKSIVDAEAERRKNELDKFYKFYKKEGRLQDFTPTFLSTEVRGRFYVQILGFSIRAFDPQHAGGLKMTHKEIEVMWKRYAEKQEHI